MKFKDFFDRAYIINLPSRDDRRQEIIQELKHISMPLMPGKVEIFPAIRPDSPGLFKSIGYRGAFLSHLAILKKAKEEGAQNVLVIEDDLEIRENFLQYESIITQELLSNDWDIAHFGYGNDRTPMMINLPILHPFEDEIIGAQFYGVNAKAFDTLIHFFEVVMQRPAGHPEGGAISPDGVFNVFKWQYPDIVRLIAVPSFGNQRSSRSDISPKWYDQVSVLKPMASLARKLKIKAILKKIKSYL